MDFSEGTENEGEEKNSSSIQAKWGRREKSFLTTQRKLLVCKVDAKASYLQWQFGWWPLKKV